MHNKNVDNVDKVKPEILPLKCTVDKLAKLLDLG